MHPYVVTTSVAMPGPLGGANNELGAELRARFAAYAASFGLRGMDLPIRDHQAQGVPSVVRCEVDEPVDDVEIRFTNRRRVLVQVKRHLSLQLGPGSPLSKTLDQWIEQCSGDPLDHDTALIAVAQTATRDVIHLADALEAQRDPHAAALTSAQLSALKKLKAELRKRAPAVADMIFARCSIWVQDFSRGGPAALAAVGLLDGNVVTQGQGDAAFAVLAGAHQERAARRSGLDLNGWIAALRGAHLHVIANSAGCRSAERAAQIEVVARYCERLVRLAKTVDLSSLGVALPPIDAVAPATVVNGRSKADLGVDLDVALRRYGRTLLLGQPGAGKSTMLRWLAGMEARRGWSLPVVIDLRALLTPSGFGGLPIALQLNENPLDALAALAAASTSVEDRGLLIGAIRLAAADGTLLICLDSLDETRQYRHEVVSWIRTLLGRISPNCDLVLSTRTSAYSAAATLRWQELWVSTPRSTNDIASNVLEAFASQGGQDSSWVHQRFDWVLQNIQRSPSLAETPLLVTALSVEAAERHLLNTITGRARLIESIIDRVASSWERGTHRIGVELPSGLHSAQVAEALGTTLDHLSWTIVNADGPVQIDPLWATVAAVLASEHGIATGPARALATSAIHFWDEAGIVVLDRDGTVEARTRHVVEVSAARYAARLQPGARKQAIIGLAAEATNRDVLVSLASIDTDAAIDMINTARVNADPALALAAAAGLAENPATDSTVASQLIEAVTSNLSGEEAHDAVAIQHLIQLPITSVNPRQILEIVDRQLPPRAALVWSALITSRWDLPTAYADCANVIAAGSPPPPPPPAGVSEFAAMLFFDETRTAFGEVVLEMSRRLTSGDQKLAKQVLDLAYTQCPHRLAEAVYAELKQRGHPYRPPREVAVAWKSSRSDDCFNKAFEWLLKYLLRAAPHQLPSTVERRRLQELSRLMGKLAIGKGQSGEFENTVQSHPNDLTTLTELIINQGNIDRDLLSAEIASFLKEFQQDQFAWLLLIYDSPRCRLRWQNQDEVESLIMNAEHLFSCNQWLATRTASILCQVPANQRKRAAGVAARAARAQIPPGQRQVASFAALHCDATVFGSQWRNSSDPLLAASVIANVGTAANRSEIIIEGLHYPDNLVREVAVKQLDAGDLSTDSLLNALTQARQMPDEGTCRYCSAIFTLWTPNCGNCELSLPDPNHEIDRLLAKAPGSTDKGTNVVP
jgi:NACHT domain